jgi:hypothetical protein
MRGNDQELYWPEGWMAARVRECRKNLGVTLLVTPVRPL